MKENIYKFAHSSIRGSKASVKWATELKDLVKEGKIEEAIKKAEPYKDIKKPGIPNIYSYLINNKMHQLPRICFKRIFYRKWCNRKWEQKYDAGKT